MRIMMWTIAIALLPSLAWGQACPGAGEVVLNEVRYTPKDDAFIEIWGPANAPLSCLKLMAFNGGQDGSSCDGSTAYQFAVDDVIGADGYFVLATNEAEGVDRVTAKADLQNGPDGVQLVDTASGNVLDSLAYGGPMEDCESPVMEGNSPAPAHTDTASIGRTPDHQDTNDNGADWVLCPEPSPGLANSCPLPPDCSAGPESDGVAISEVAVGPSGEEFVEVSGPSGTDLGCYVLRTWNGGSDNDKCDLDEEQPLVGQVLNPNGLHATFFDLQKGPDAVELVYLFSDGTEESVDALIWKENMPQCPAALQGGEAAVVPPDGESLSRCYDFGDYNKDYTVTEATPGDLNMCPAPCTGPTGTVVINEVVIDPNELAFVELRGEPGLDLSCYTLLELNSGQAQDQCEVEKQLALDGIVIPDDGYLVLGAADVASLDVEQKWAAQNGPGDGFRLVYEGDAEELVVDTFSWGATLSACTDPPSTDSGFGPAAKEGLSTARCPDGRDTNNNNVDLMEAISATPGSANNCPDLAALAVCDNPPSNPVVINELLTSPGLDAFVELKGAPNTALGCFTLLAYNGGPEGALCDIYETISMPGAVIGESGYFVVAPEDSSAATVADFLDGGADLQDGPDALALIFTQTNGQQILMDAVVYGGELAACDDFGEGGPADKPGKGRSLTRCAGSDTQSNEGDFATCAAPSPGQPTTCDCGAPNPAGGSVDVESPTGCRSLGGMPWFSLLALLGLGLMVWRRRQTRQEQG